MSASQDGLLRMMEAEAARLHNAADHLVRSIAELRAAIHQEGDEGRQFQQAIEVRARPGGWAMAARPAASEQAPAGHSE